MLLETYFTHTLVGSLTPGFATLVATSSPRPRPRPRAAMIVLRKLWRFRGDNSQSKLTSPFIAHDYFPLVNRLSGCHGAAGWHCVCTFHA